MLAIDVFRDQVNWFEGDIKSCIRVSEENVKNKQDFPGGQNYTACLVALCFLEFLASCFKGKAKVNDNDIAEFAGRYLSPSDAIFNNHNFTKQLLNVFRHGLAHQWAPKYGGVAMDQSWPTFLAQGENRLPILVVPAFFTLLKNGLNSYQNALETDPDLKSNLQKRYDDVNNKDREQSKLLVESIEAYLSKNF